MVCLYSCRRRDRHDRAEAPKGAVARSAQAADRTCGGRRPAFFPLASRIGRLCALALWLAPPWIARADGPIEAEYRRDPAVAITYDNTTLSDYVLAYPTLFSGVKHPVVVLGIGTLSAVSMYRPMIEHLAKWNYTVIVPKANTVGDGTELVLGLLYLLSANDTPGHVLYGRLDLDKVAAVGHSQGAIGAINATINADGLIKSTVTWAMPDTCNYMDTNRLTEGILPLPDLSQIETPVFFIRGSDDELATETGSDADKAVYLESWCTGERARNRGVSNFWFGGVQGMSAKASRLGITDRPIYHLCNSTYGGGELISVFPEPFMGLSVGTVHGLPLASLDDHCFIIDHHIDIYGRPRDYAAGYTTAWLKFTLEGDTVAAGAFTGPAPEIANNPDWTNWDFKP